MIKNTKITPAYLLTAMLLTLAACGGGGSSGGEQAVVSIELVDPTPGADDRFGEVVVQLANGNIVVTDPGDSSVASKNGAVHLYSRFSPTPIASIYGDNADDELGKAILNNGKFGSITELTNGNFVIVSQFEDEGGVQNVGSARLMNGTTGAQIGDTLFGATVNDFAESSKFITALPSGNFIMTLPFKTVGGIASAGSVQLMNGSTGEPIGSALEGDSAGDEIGSFSISVLENSNYAVVSPDEDIAGKMNVGSVRLMKGSTGEQIGTTIAGDIAEDQIGGRGIVELSNNNYLIATSKDDHLGGLVDAGSVTLVDGNTGLQIGNSLNGADGEKLGLRVAILANGNYVVGNLRDDNGAGSDVGSVKLMDGNTAEQIGVTLFGDSDSDFLSSGGVFALGNANYAVLSSHDDEGGIVNAGSIRLINSTTNVQIGASIVGDLDNDQLGTSLTTLANNNFIIMSRFDNEGGVVDAGSIRLVNGETGAQIGPTLAGASVSDRIHDSKIVELTNNNYVVANPNTDIGGVDNIGTARLFNGSTGVQIGTTLTGTVANDRIGNGLVALPNNNYVVLSNGETHEGAAQVGSARIMNGITAEQIGDTFFGDLKFDFASAFIVKGISSSYIILSQPDADKTVSGSVEDDFGKVRILTL